MHAVAAFEDEKNGNCCRLMFGAALFLETWYKQYFEILIYALIWSVYKREWK